MAALSVDEGFEVSFWYWLWHSVEMHQGFYLTCEDGTLKRLKLAPDDCPSEALHQGFSDVGRIGKSLIPKILLDGRLDLKEERTVITLKELGECARLLC